MMKYELLPKQLLHEGSCGPDNFFEPDLVDEDYVLAVHTEEYYHDLLENRITPRAARKIGFPVSPELVTRELTITDGTIKGCQFALRYGISMNIAGGTHHAYTDRGEAFCLLNDQAIGARYLQHEGIAKKILIVDLDVHQGNGTAEIFQGDPSVFTFSMHGAGNYPFKKEVSDLDIPLAKGTTDVEYLTILEGELPKIISMVRPDFIFYLSGVDVLASDKLGTLALTKAGCRRRDEFVLNTCRDLEIPVQCSMGGGYSPDIRDIVDAHANTYRAAQQIYF